VQVARLLESAALPFDGASVAIERNTRLLESEAIRNASGAAEALL
jgi:hypothetical protein